MVMHAMPVLPPLASCIGASTGALPVEPGQYTTGSKVTSKNRLFKTAVAWQVCCSAFREHLPPDECA